MIDTETASLATSGFDGGSPAEHRHATWLELFYDLVYIVAVAVLARQLSDNLSIEGLAVFAGLFISVWWSWAGHTIFATRFGRDDNFQRGMTLLQMLASAALAVQLPQALGSGSAGFAAAYVATRATLLILYVRARSQYPEASRLTAFFLAGYSTGAALWLFSIAFDPPLRYLFWAAGIGIEFGTFLLARKVARQFPVHTFHLPERVGLFTMIVLGEAVLAIIVGVGDVNWNPLAVVAAFVGFAIATSIWWNYFGYVDRAVLECTLGNGQGYMFLHLPMLIGLIAMSVGIEHIIVDSSRAVLPPEAMRVLGGGLALWIAAFYSLQLFTYPRRERRRLTATYGVALAGIVPLTLLGGLIQPIVLITLFGTISVGITLLEVRRRAAILTGVYSSKERTAPQAKLRGPKEYIGADITVRFDPQVCIHSAECLTRLPDVFDLRDRPWVNTDGAHAEAIKNTIAHCPSGALTHRPAEEGHAQV
ncbi:MAG: low temperature requirement protein A [Candidatus Neomarinimicrobiota bacterium]